jgi:hypothetical protein
MKSPIDMRRFNVPQLKVFLAFSVKDRYQLNYYPLANEVAKGYSNATVRPYKGGKHPSGKQGIW